MIISSRREFIKSGMSLAAAGTFPATAFAALGPNDKFDFLIRNANVLDPS
jgi:dihydroorotase